MKCLHQPKGPTCRFEAPPTPPELVIGRFRLCLLTGMPHSTSERPRKKIKLDHATPQIVQCVPTDFLDICRALPTLDPDVLPKGRPAFTIAQCFFFHVTTALSTLRSKLSFKLDQEISSNDDRLLSIKAWLETSPGLQDVFDVWERISQVCNDPAIIWGFIPSSSIVVHISLAGYNPYFDSFVAILPLFISCLWCIDYQVLTLCALRTKVEHLS